MASIAEIKQALVNAHKAGDTDGANKLAGILKQQLAVIPRTQEEVNKEYEAMPWYQKAGQAADDLVRIGADGISFGALDRWLGPEQQKLTDEARMRAGTAAIPAEILGTLYSPITGAVGALGKAATTVAPGLLARIGIGAAEGGTLGAADAAIKGKDITDGATTGAAIAGAIPIIGKSLAKGSSFLQGTKSGAIEDAYTAGKEGGSISKAFRQGQAGKQITNAKDDFAAAESAWNKGATVDPRVLKNEFNKIRSEVRTSNGVTKLNREDESAFKEIVKTINGSLRPGSTVENMDALRRRLETWSNGSETQKMIATRLKDAIRKSVEKVQPGYVDDLTQYSKAKTAQAAGKELNTFFPKGSLLGHLAQGALFGSSIVGAPIIGPGVAAAAPSFSPKISGLIANILGEGVGRTGANLGASAPLWSNYQDRKKKDTRNRKARAPLEISIPGADLP